MKIDRVKLALDKATQTKALCIGQGVLVEVPRIFSEQFPNRRAMVVADQSSYEVAGREVEEHLRQAGIPLDDSYIFN